LLIVSDQDLTSSQQQQITKFISFVWDTGLEVGHSVRTIEQCVTKATQDITVATNLVESRLLIGSSDVFKSLQKATGPNEIWPSKTFFQAKVEEQNERHHKYDDTAYSLEPNVKSGMGGLRDLHTIAWVAKRHFNVRTLRELIQHGFLTNAEYNTLVKNRDFLWKVRFLLHVLSNRHEDRLLFDFQKSLAKKLGYHDQKHNLAIEQFMNDYYRVIKSMREMNDMLLQLFREAILFADKDKIEPINKYFQIRNDYIEIRDAAYIKKDPTLMLEIFLHLLKDKTIKGVRASTIRLIREHRHLINEEFRNNFKAHKIFLEILQQNNPNIHKQLQRMNRYGMLENYITEFANIIGRMQYDLFHVYTVDQHTLFLVRNIGRFLVDEYKTQFPTAAEIMGKIKKPHLLYIAAIFHDIAKGRGGDHSELGAEDARKFCARHKIDQHDTDLVAWLVHDHLLISATAQRKDIYDPEVVYKFADLVETQERLDYLFVLTVADICATNPTLWNSWRSTLFDELYRSATKALAEKHLPLNKAAIIRTKKKHAREELKQKDYKQVDINNLWKNLPRDYFLREPINNIVWHSHEMLQHGESIEPIILIKQHEKQGGTEVFVYTPELSKVFLTTTTVLSNQGLNILEAQLFTLKNHYSLSSYIVHDEKSKPIYEEERLKEIRDLLVKYHNPGASTPRIKQYRIPRKLKHFHILTEVNFSFDTTHNRTNLELISADRPGLLAGVARAFKECEIRLHGAKIATMGERVEDNFAITYRNNKPIKSVKKQDELKKLILKYLDIRK